ncbi:MAG: ATP-dependent Clp protease ATP-binding subunit [Clostridiales bacterium]|nr:ATP-dependent Clp protease ATP-binding subunit [Clostridiales bacterium]
MKMTPAAKIAFLVAALEAKNLGSETIEIEHIVIGICKTVDLDDELLQNLGDVRADTDDWLAARAEIDAIRARIEAADGDVQAMRRRLRYLLVEHSGGQKVFSGHRSDTCRALFAQVEAGDADGVVRLAALYDAAVASGSALLGKLFREQGIRGDAPALEPETPQESGGGVSSAVRAGKAAPKPRSRTPFLDQYGRDITRLAREGALDPVIGREEEIRQIEQILIQHKKNNPILVGDPGVGKTCIVEGLAQRLILPNAPRQLKDLRIVEIPIASLVAGTKYRGDFEERVLKLLREAAQSPEIVLFLDEIHQMVGAGSSENSPSDVGNLLKPALARGELKCIGATTTAEYRRHIEKDASLERRFQQVWVTEPSAGEAVEIVRGLRERYERHYGVTIPDEAVEKAVALTIRYLPDFRLPDKALDMIDQACARKVLLPATAGEGGAERPVLTGRDIARVVAQRSRVPADFIAQEESERLLRLEADLQKRVLGQEGAIRAVAQTIRNARAGLRDPRKPMGVFLFLGATGTGKTELAKALAETLFSGESHLLTFDMSEYQEKHTVARLIGAPPGYVGYDQEGLLTGRVRTNPYAVVLFDEIEKAHPDLFNLFLQIFDEGRLTDAHGRQVSFSDTVIILTSNLGSRDAQKRPIGFAHADSRPAGGAPPAAAGAQTAPEPQDAGDGRWAYYEDAIQKAVREALRPEILNRITHTVIFYPLDRPTVYSIIDQITARLNRSLAARALTVTLDESAKALLMERGYSAEFGAREMQRAFERAIDEPLAQMILKGEPQAGDTIRVAAEGGEMRLIRGTETGA